MFSDSWKRSAAGALVGLIVAVLSATGAQKARTTRGELSGCSVFPSVTSDLRLANDVAIAVLTFANLDEHQTGVVEIEAQPTQGGQPFKWWLAVEPRTKERASFSTVERARTRVLLTAFDGFVIVRTFDADIRVSLETLKLNRAEPTYRLAIEYGLPCNEQRR